MSDTPGEFSKTVTLIRKARSGESGALGELMERYRPKLLARVRKQMGRELRDFAESEDLLQELFVDIVEGFDRLELRDEEAFLRWATRIAQNNARDQARRRRLRAMQMLMTSMGGAQTGGPSRAAEQQEEIARLEAALQELPEDYRRVIELRNLEGLAFADIAERLEKPTANAVQMLHARALAKLTALLSRKS